MPQEQDLICLPQYDEFDVLVEAGFQVSEESEESEETDDEHWGTERDVKVQETECGAKENKVEVLVKKVVGGLIALGR